MKPAQFLAHIRKANAFSAARAYRASATEDSRQLFLTLHPEGGTHYDALPYQHLALMTGEEAGTRIRLTFRIPLVITGRNLLPVFHSLRQQRCSDLYQFDAKLHDEPEADAPVITSITIEAAARE